MNVELRAERPEDRRAIYELTERAFRPMPYADGDEQDVIDRLRERGALALSLVAVIEGELVGHVAFSPARASDGSEPWFALGPVSVEPARQSLGIGSKLIVTGLEQLEDRGALGCILIGNPAYYRRFGFEVAAQHAPDEPREFFQLKLLDGAAPEGTLHFHDAFFG